MDGQFPYPRERHQAAPRGPHADDPSPTAGREPAPRGRRPEHALSADFVRTVAEPGRYCDGQGLYLEVQPSGSRSWVQRLAVRGRRREMGLGSFPLVSLDEARNQAFANRKLARAGGDPVAARRAADEPTFADAAERVWRQMRPGWRNPRYGRDWLSGLTRVAFPCIGRMPVGAVTTADVIETLRPVWHAGRRRRGGCCSASAWSWSGRWPWGTGAPTRAGASTSCWVASSTRRVTCRRCRTARWRGQWRRCGGRGRGWW